MTKTPAFTIKRIIRYYFQPSSALRMLRLSKQRIALWVGLTVSGLCLNSAWSYSPSIHGQLCDSAYGLLEEKQQRWLLGLLAWQHFPAQERKQHRRQFASFNTTSNAKGFKTAKQKQEKKLVPKQSIINYACQRADFIKVRSQAPFTEISPSNQHRASSHYINLDQSERRFDWSRICARQLCTTDALRHYIRRFLNTKDANQRSAALGHTGHLLADLHQPMHVGFTEDRGGNRIKVYWRKHRKSTNLHRLWDGDLPWELDFDFAETKSGLLEYQDSYLEIWARETFEAARDVAYRHPSGRSIRRGDRLGERYFKQVAKTAGERMDLARRRIAGLWTWLYQQSNE